MNVKSRKVEQAEGTRAALLAVARELFAQRGYAATPIEEVVRRARVTRGALYHHFRDKQQLFRAVFEEEERRLVEAVTAKVSGTSDAWRMLIEGCSVFLDACLEPSVQRIVLIDAPAVLGWDTWRIVEEQYGLGLIETGLKAAMEEGVIERQPTGPLAHMLTSALNEAGLLIARASDVAAARAEIGGTVMRLLEGLRVRSAAIRPGKPSAPRRHSARHR